MSRAERYLLDVDNTLYLPGGYGIPADDVTGAMTPPKLRFSNSALNEPLIRALACTQGNKQVCLYSSVSVIQAASTNESRALECDYQHAKVGTTRLKFLTLLAANQLNPRGLLATSCTLYNDAFEFGNRVMANELRVARALQAQQLQSAPPIIVPSLEGLTESQQAVLNTGPEYLSSDYKQLARDDFFNNYLCLLLVHYAAVTDLAVTDLKDVNHLNNLKEEFIKNLFLTELKNPANPQIRRILDEMFVEYTLEKELRLTEQERPTREEFTEDFESWVNQKIISDDSGYSVRLAKVVSFFKSIQWGDPFSLAREGLSDKQKEKIKHERAKLFISGKGLMWVANLQDSRDDVPMVFRIMDDKEQVITLSAILASKDNQPLLKGHAIVAMHVNAARWYHSKSCYELFLNYQDGNLVRHEDDVSAWIIGQALCSRLPGTGICAAKGIFLANQVKTLSDMNQVKDMPEESLYKIIPVQQDDGYCYLVVYDKAKDQVYEFPASDAALLNRKISRILDGEWIPENWCFDINEALQKLDIGDCLNASSSRVYSEGKVVLQSLVNEPQGQAFDKTMPRGMRYKLIPVNGLDDFNLIIYDAARDCCRRLKFISEQLAGVIADFINQPDCKRSYMTYTLVDRINQSWADTFSLPTNLICGISRKERWLHHYLGVPRKTDPWYSKVSYAFGGFLINPIKNSVKLLCVIPLAGIECILEQASERMTASALPFVVKGVLQAFVHLALAVVTPPRLITKALLSPFVFVRDTLAQCKEFAKTISPKSAPTVGSNVIELDFDRGSVFVEYARPQDSHSDGAESSLAASRLSQQGNTEPNVIRPRGNSPTIWGVAGQQKDAGEKNYHQKGVILKNAGVS